MNLVGKILVVLVLIMSVCFMAFAVAVYATHKNHFETLTRKQAGADGPLGLIYQLKQSKDENLKLQADQDRLKNDHEAEMAAREKVLAAAETKAKNMDEELKMKAAMLATKEAELATSLAEVQTLTKTLNDKLDQVNVLTAEIGTARTERDDNFKKAVELTDKLHQAEGTLSLLTDQNKRLADQMAKANLVLQRNNLKLDSPVGPPPLDGVVLAAGSNGMVEISLGSDDGLQRGNVLEVFRLGAANSKYLGKIEILHTQPEKSVAKVIPEFRKGIIEKHDRVATQLR